MCRDELSLMKVCCINQTCTQQVIFSRSLGIKVSRKLQTYYFNTLLKIFKAHDLKMMVKLTLHHERGTAWHRGSISTSHKAILGTNLTSPESWQHRTQKALLHQVVGC